MTNSNIGVGGGEGVLLPLGDLVDKSGTPLSYTLVPTQRTDVDLGAKRTIKNESKGGEGHSNRGSTAASATPGPSMMLSVFPSTGASSGGLQVATGDDGGGRLLLLLGKGIQKWCEPQAQMPNIWATGKDRMASRAGQSGVQESLLQFCLRQDPSYGWYRYFTSSPLFYLPLPFVA